MGGVRSLYSIQPWCHIIRNPQLTDLKHGDWMFRKPHASHEADWELACLKAQKQSINTRIKLLQSKWLMRTYITPVKLSRWSPSIPDTCIKCLEEKGTLYHCVWECPKLNEYWKTVVEALSEVVGVKVPHQTKLCILGIYPSSFSVTSKQMTLIDLGLLQARRTIACLGRKRIYPR